MTLTSRQLNALRHDLKTLVEIKYDHLRDELLDHYATLTEEKMNAGYVFDDASTAAWIEMGNGEGIQRIQTDYEAVTKRDIRARHWQIVKSLWSWPTIVSTLLIGVLTTYLIALMPATTFAWHSDFIGYMPVLVLWFGWVYYWRVWDKSQFTLLREYLSKVWAWALYITLTIRILPHLAFEYSPTLLAAANALNVYFVVFISVSLLRLMRAHFEYKIVR
jgi:hypothetical protein